MSLHIEIGDQVTGITGLMSHIIAFVETIDPCVGGDDVLEIKITYATAPSDWCAGDVTYVYRSTMKRLVP